MNPKITKRLGVVLLAMVASVSVLYAQPMVDNVEVLETTHNTATLYVVISASSDLVTVQASNDEFDTYKEFYDVPCGGTTLIIDGLTPLTTYSRDNENAFYLVAIDPDENCSEEKLVPIFTTKDAPTVSATTYNWYMIEEDDGEVENADWVEVGTPKGWDRPYTPDIYYAITTNVDNTLTFNVYTIATDEEVPEGLKLEVLNNGKPMEDEPRSPDKKDEEKPDYSKERFSFTTNYAFERGEVLPISFRFTYIGEPETEPEPEPGTDPETGADPVAEDEPETEVIAVSTTVTFNFVVGSSEVLPTAVERVEVQRGSVYAADGCIYINNANANDCVEVYNVAGQLVYSAVATERVELNLNGVYVVKVGGATYKVVL